MQELMTRLVEMAPSPHPFLSVYLDTRPAEAGRAQGRRQRTALVWLRRRLGGLLAGMPARSEARASMESDVQKIEHYLEGELKASTQGVAIFACSARGFFEPHQVALPLENRVSLDEMPHVYPLARLLDGHRACGVVLIDSEHARIYAVALGRVLQALQVEHRLEKPERGSRTTAVSGAGGAFGASTLRYQRHLEGQILHHLKDVADRLEAIVRHERLEHLVLSGQEAVVREFNRLLPRALREMVFDRLALEVDTPENEVIRRTVHLLAAHTREQLGRRVDWLLGEYRAGGLAAVGLESCLRALNDQNMVELLLNTDFEGTGLRCRACDLLMQEASEDGRCRHCGGETRIVTDLREFIVGRAERLGAKVRPLEGHAELRRHGGIGALLRYRRQEEPARP